MVACMVVLMLYFYIVSLLLRLLVFLMLYILLYCYLTQIPMCAVEVHEYAGHLSKNTSFVVHLANI